MDENAAPVITMIPELDAPVATMRPDFVQAPATKTVEQHAAEAKTPAWMFDVAKATNRWAIGSEMSRASYDAAISGVNGHVIR